MPLKFDIVHMGQGGEKSVLDHQYGDHQAQESTKQVSITHCDSVSLTTLNVKYRRSTIRRR